MKSKRLVIFLLMIMTCVVCSNAQKRPAINRSIFKVDSKKGQSSTVTSSSGPKKQIAKKTTNHKNSTKKRSSAPRFSISSTSANFDYRGGSKSFTVSSSGKWEIDVYPATWGTLTRNGNTLILNTSANNSSNSRTDWFAIKSGNKSIRVDIYQDKGQYLDVSSQEVSFTASGGVKTIIISSGEAWQIGESTASWGHITKNGSQLTLKVDANNSSSSRTDWFTVKSGTIEKRINISQEGQQSHFSVSSEYLRFSHVRSSQTITIYTNKNWYISVNTRPWAHLSRNGNYLTVSVDANNSTSGRSDYFCLKSGDTECRINISQAGMDSYYDSYGNTYSQSNSNYYNSYSRENPHTKWWKENFSVGVDGDFEINTGAETMYYSAGLLFRFGQPEHLFNIITGAKYRWISVKIKENKSYYYASNEHFESLGGYVGIPLNCRFNIASLGKRTAFYLAAEGEYGILISEKGGYKDVLNKKYISVSPQIGCTSRHFDIALYWKYYINDPLKEWKKTYLKKKSEYTFGVQISAFF